MNEQLLLIGDIPARCFTPEGARGLLLLGHGGGHGKDVDRFVRLSRDYAERTGLSVVSIDAVDHGERRAVDVASDLPRGWHSRTIPQMVADWQSVAHHLKSVGPPRAYVGFSMGALFGFATVVAMPTVAAAVFVVGGIPGSGWTDDERLAPTLRSAAENLDHAHVLMANKDADELFPAPGVHELFDSVVAQSKRLQFWPGGHDEWGPDLIDETVMFINRHVGQR